MWPFSCKNCVVLENKIHHWVNRALNAEKENKSLKLVSRLQWQPYDTLGLIPSLANILVANKDFTYFGFMYIEDGWDYSRKINMFGKSQIWATYTNTDSIAWWLNLDEIKKG